MENVKIVASHLKKRVKLLEKEFIKKRLFGIILFEKWDFGDYPFIASDCARGGGTFVWVEPKTLRP